MNEQTVQQRLCSVEGCSKNQYCRTFCKAHYSRLYIHGSPTGGRIKKYGCLVNDCVGCHHSHGYCNKHYSRLVTYGDPLKLTRKERSENYIQGDIGYIELTKGAFALIDAKDFERVAKYRWCFSGNGYALSWIKGKLEYLHHFVLPPQSGLVNDHINRNRLDNRSVNLRRVTYSENNLNRG